MRRAHIYVFVCRHVHFINFRLQLNRCRRRLGLTKQKFFYKDIAVAFALVSYTLTSFYFQSGAQHLPFYLKLIRPSAQHSTAHFSQERSVVTLYARSGHLVCTIAGFAPPVSVGPLTAPSGNMAVCTIMPGWSSLCGWSSCDSPGVRLAKAAKRS